MEEIKDLAGNDAINKLKSILVNNPTCMLISAMNIKHPSVCPMTVKTIEDNGDIWFLSYKDSEHYENIQKDPNVLLTFANDIDQQYLSITGNGVHSDSEELINILWDDSDKQWYANGRNDENIVVLKVAINDAYYWDQTEQRSKPIQ
ncbi:MAG: pyridoxamine 5'-phosphate oxidase family protein [Flavobacteriaceae bacterium]|nr:pyridoxamine 5'-phosphate oxidase family protein [Flavobacteriaceae bacterium]